MISRSDSLKERLLAQHAPDRDKLAEYKKEVQAMLDRNEQELRREKWYVGGMWIFVVLTTTAFLIIGGFMVSGWRQNTSVGLWFGINACFWFLFGAVFLLKYFINRSRVELLKEIKALEMQVLEIKEQLGPR